MKGQIQLMESTFALFGFFFILVIGMVMYGNFQDARLESLENNFEQQQAIQIAQKVLFTPELQCSNNGVLELNCFDIQKLERFQKESSTLFYREEFPNTRVNVTLAYLPSLPPQIDRPDFFETENTKTLFDFHGQLEDRDAFYFPITLWDKRFVPERSYFGWVIVEVYS